MLALALDSKQQGWVVSVCVCGGALLVQEIGYARLQSFMLMIKSHPLRKKQHVLCDGVNALPLQKVTQESPM